MLNDDDKIIVSHEVARYIVDLVIDMSEIMSKRDNNNHASIEEAPPLMSAEIVSLSHKHFVADVLDPLGMRLQSSGWTEIDIDNV